MASSELFSSLKNAMVIFVKNQILPSSENRVGSSPEARMTFHDLKKQVEIDLAPVDGGHWSQEDWHAILRRADENFSLRISSESTPSDLRARWAEVATAFHREKNWNFRPQSKRREKPLTQEQKTFREIFPYIWAFIQSTLIIKFAIYYFGIQSADDPSVFNLVGLISCLALSFCSLVFFAWRMHQKEESQKT